MGTLFCSEDLLEAFKMTDFDNIQIQDIQVGQANMANQYLCTLIDKCTPIDKSKWTLVFLTLLPKKF
jgi:hypothetical protein